ncbi:MAG: 4-hydroxy-tetrahydrodipicolinate reductase [Wenzhouxiangella sp.]
MRILLSGASGAVGGEIRRLVDADPRLELAGLASRSAFFEAGAQGDVLIDFSHPALTLRCLDLAGQQGLPIVIGTTGLDQACRQRIREVARTTPVCVAANFSIGVTVMQALAAHAAAAIPASFDIEIAETHHRRKIDAPSGTAVALAEAVAAARDQRLHDVAVMDRSHRRSARPPGEIGFQVSRGGDVVGEHTVHFLGDGERLEITHRASDRSIFARGALLAAERLVGHDPGQVEFRDLVIADLGADRALPGGGNPARRND